MYFIIGGSPVNGMIDVIMTIGPTTIAQAHLSVADEIRKINGLKSNTHVYTATIKNYDTADQMRNHYDALCKKIEKREKLTHLPMENGTG